MFVRPHNLFFLLAFLKLSLPAFGQKWGFAPVNGIQLVAGPAIGIYKVNTRHAIEPYTKAGATIGFRKVFRLDREHLRFFHLGADYLYHGLGFRSYYFMPDSLQLYDKSFAYNYSLMVHEAQAPLLLRFLFKRRKAKVYSPFVQLGYHLRYLLSSDLKIRQNSAKVRYDSPEVYFKNKLFHNQLSSMVSAAIGLQKNTVGSVKGNFYVELGYRYGFSPWYFERNYAPSSMFFSGSHVTLVLGVKL